MSSELDMRLWKCPYPECRQCLRILGLYGARLLLWASKRGIDAQEKFKTVSILVRGEPRVVADLRDRATGDLILDAIPVKDVVYVARTSTPFYAMGRVGHTPGHLAALVIYEQEE